MELSKEQRHQAKAEKRAAKMAARGEYPDLVVPSDPSGAITVLCVRFGNKYGREYVERLRNMVSRHLTVPYEFACLTDDQHPMDGVRTIYQPNANYARGWWHKVHMFDPGLGLRGRVLYFDLDMIIYDTLPNLVRKNFTLLDDTWWREPAHTPLNSSIVSWTGDASYIWDKFKKDEIANRINKHGWIQGLIEVKPDVGLIVAMLALTAIMALAGLGTSKIAGAITKIGEAKGFGVNLMKNLKGGFGFANGGSR